MKVKRLRKILGHKEGFTWVEKKIGDNIFYAVLEPKEIIRKPEPQTQQTAVLQAPQVSEKPQRIYEIPLDEPELLQ